MATLNVNLETIIVPKAETMLQNSTKKVFCAEFFSKSNIKIILPTVDKKDRHTFSMYNIY